MEFNVEPSLLGSAGYPRTCDFEEASSVAAKAAVLKQFRKLRFGSGALGLHALISRCVLKSLLSGAKI
jgi:hypothetical protein